MLIALCKERKTYKEQLYIKGFYPLTKAEGTRLYKKYKETN